MGLWVFSQRRFFRSDELREDRKQLLDEIGFEWKIQQKRSDELWQSKYEELQEFKKKCGHVNVSLTENPPLYYWIRNQSILQQAGRLSLKRKEMLDELGLDL